MSPASTDKETMDPGNSEIENELTELINSHPLVEKLRSSESIRESRAVLRVDPEIVANNLTASKLTGPNGIHPPVVFFNNTEGVLYAFYRLGEGLAGHRSLLHGGFTSVLLDECMGRACFPLLAKNIAVTASLNITYRKPISIPGVVLVAAKTSRVEGRKAWVEGWIEDVMTGSVYVAAEALFIEPREAEAMSRMM